MSWTSLCELSELDEDRGRFVEISGFQLAVYLNAGQVYVMDNYCPHAGGNLAGGHVDEGCAICPWHGWAFRDSPGVTVKTYRTRLLVHQGKQLVQADLPIY